MLRPVMPTLRLYLAARSMIWRIRSTLEAKVVMMIRLSQSLNSLSKRSYTRVSEGHQPGRSTLVESISRARTPSFPSSPKRVRSVISP